MSNSKYILIDTKNINNIDNKYNFRYYLSEYIEIKKYIELQLLILPRMNFFINKNNNTFQVKLYKDNNNYIVNFNLASQNYTPLSLCEQINLLFSAPNGITFNASYNQYTYKITFTSNVNFDLNLSLSSFNKVISLEKKVYYSDINKQISSFIIFNTPNYIKLNLNNITSTNIVNNNNQNIETSFIIPVINRNFGEIIEYTSLNYPFKIQTNIKTNYLDISILDDDNNIFDNNNYNWVGIIKFE